MGQKLLELNPGHKPHGGKRLSKVSTRALLRVGPAAQECGKMTGASSSELR